MFFGASTSPFAKGAMILRCAAFLALPAVVGAQRQADVLVGRVQSNGVPVVGAVVSATMAPDRSFQQMATDATGAFRIRFESGTGDYLVHVASAGFQPFRKRIQRATGDSVMRVDVELLPIVVARLDTVHVRAIVPKPSRSPQFGLEPGAQQSVADALVGSLDPADASSLASIVGTVPGVTLSGGLPIFLGLPSTQNGATLNGLTFSGVDIPREADTRIRVSSSVYDPSRGGFSAGQIAVELAPGELYSHRTGNASGRIPSGNGSAERVQLGGSGNQWRGGLGGNGMLVDNTLFYNMAAQISERMLDVTPLDRANDVTISAAGISLPAFRSSLDAALGAHAPISALSAPRSVITRSGSAIGRFDYKPLDYATFKLSPRTWSITAYAQASQDDGLNRLVNATSSHEGHYDQVQTSVQGTYSAFLPGAGLNETRSGVMWYDEKQTPYLGLPALDVQAVSAASSPVSSFLFGGAGTSPLSRTRWSWETTNETQWISSNVQHRFKLYAQSFLEGQEQRADASAGEFRFASTDALVANRPVSYIRTIGAAHAAATEWSGTAALGDVWQATPRLTVIYGARSEVRHWLSMPAVPAGVDGAAPQGADLHVSPRLGFSWLYSGGDGGYGEANSNLGRRLTRYTGSVRGGIGEFRSHVSPELFSGTGLASQSVLTCVGAAAPSPDWPQYESSPSSIPSQCVGGNGLEPFSESAPRIAVVDRSYSAPRSWRSNVAWTGRFVPLLLTVEGTYSLNLNQPSAVDLNLTTTPLFRVASEGDRPVFIAPSSIEPSTGVGGHPVRAAFPSYSEVISRRSDMRSESRQLTVTVTPNLPFGSYYASGSYTLGEVTTRTRGLDETTAGDPAAIDIGPGRYDIRHQVLTQMGTTRKGMAASLLVRAQSGSPYTPMVDRDINGDGRANDRAFIPRVDQLTTDTSTARQWQQVLARSDCLTWQTGVVASQNSCRGSWTVYSNATIVLLGGFHGVSKRLRLSMNIANPIAGLDRAIHGGAGTGWLSGGLVDPVLFRVRGFDPISRTFGYQVNEDFGRVSSISSYATPVRLTLEAQFNWGVPAQRQQLERVLNVGRNGRSGAPLSQDSIRIRFARNVSDIYNQVIAQNDSLLLTRDQVDSLRAAAPAYRARMRAIWDSLAAHLASLQDSYDKVDALQRTEAATVRAWQANRDESATIRSILTSLQWSLLYGDAAYVLRTTSPLTSRSFSY